jgi:hypothetical protein
MPVIDYDHTPVAGVQTLMRVGDASDDVGYAKPLTNAAIVGAAAFVLGKGLGMVKKATFLGLAAGGLYLVWQSMQKP